MPAASYALVANSTHRSHGTIAAARTASAIRLPHRLDDVVFDAHELGDPGQIVQGELLQRHAFGVVRLDLGVLDVARSVDPLDANLWRRDPDPVAGVADV